MWDSTAVGSPFIPTPRSGRANRFEIGPVTVFFNVSRARSIYLVASTTPMLAGAFALFVTDTEQCPILLLRGIEDKLPPSRYSREPRYLLSPAKLKMFVNRRKQHQPLFLRLSSLGVIRFTKLIGLCSFSFSATCEKKGGRKGEQERKSDIGVKENEEDSVGESQGYRRQREVWVRGD